MSELTEHDMDTRRLMSCIRAWPECRSGVYDPRCCRFPKSCSPYGYIEAVRAGNLTEEDLEPIGDEMRKKDNTGIVETKVKLNNEIEARKSTGEIKIVNAKTLDEALKNADAAIRKFVGTRDFTMWEANAEPSMMMGGTVLTWDVTIDWGVL